MLLIGVDTVKLKGSADFRFFGATHYDSKQVFRHDACIIQRHISRAGISRRQLLAVHPEDKELFYSFDTLPAIAAATIK